MKKMSCVATIAIAAAVPALAAQQAGGTAPAAAPPKPATLGLYVYPAKSQDATKQAADENECYTWARGQTGIDPTAAPTAVAAAEVPKGGAVKGAARGAAKGAIVGSVGDDDRQRDEGNLSAGEGAGAGAAAGAVKGRRGQKKAQKQAEAKAQEATKTQDAATKDTFKKAWGACLEGKGYSIK